LEYEFVKVDVDAAPQAKGYFAVKVNINEFLRRNHTNKYEYTDVFCLFKQCEPEFLLLRQGQEMLR